MNGSISMAQSYTGFERAGTCARHPRHHPGPVYRRMIRLTPGWGCFFPGLAVFSAKLLWLTPAPVVRFNPELSLMDGIAGPTQAPPDSAAPAESVPTSVRAEPRPRLWAWPKMHQLLFVAFTLVAAVPIAVLAIWEGQTAFQNELDSVGERHLLVPRNLTSTMSRYVKDQKATFRLVFTQGAMSQPPASLVNLLE